MTSKEKIISGFKATGIVPFNPEFFLRKHPECDEENKYKVDTELLDYLKANRSVNPLKKTINKKSQYC